MRRGWESWDSSYWRKEDLWGDLTNVYKYLMGGNEKEGTRLLSVPPIDRTRDNGHK